MIEIKDVSKRYEELIAVDHVSLSVEKGSIFGLLGPNGAGKTTLVNMMCGISPCDKGTIVIGSHCIKTDALRAKSKIGVVPQDLALIDSMCVIENLKYFGRLYGLKGSALKTALTSALDLAQLHEKKNVKVKKLSGGMKRRLNIACSTLHQPEVLILDEPTVGIDPQSRNHILEVTKLLNQNHGTTVVYITHYMEEVAKLCDRVAIMDKGKIVIEGSQDFIVDSVSDQHIMDVVCGNVTEQITYALKHYQGVRAIELTDKGLRLSVHKSDVHFGKMAQFLTEKGLDIQSMTLHRPSLEWAFLNLTGRQLRDDE